jgi:phage virion morphogenesis protein
MSEGIKITVDDPEVLSHLEQLQKAVDDIRPAEEAIGAYLVTSTQRRFERETGPDGTKWPRLSARTANRRIGGRRRGSDNILRVTRRLEQSVFSDVDQDGIHVGTNVVYAAIHQLGGEINMPTRTQTIYQHYSAKEDRLDPRFRSKGRSNFARDVAVKAHSITMPARPYLGLDDADRQEIAAIIEDHLQAAGGL